METKNSETLQVIFQRRSIRNYKNKSVSRELIDQVIQAGMMAPSAMNRQPWKFYVLSNKEKIRTFSKEIAAIAFKDISRTGIKGILESAGHLLHFVHNFNIHAIQDPVFHGAPVVIFLTAPEADEWAGLDLGMCAQNMMLAAKALGLDTCPVGFAKFVMNAAHFHELNIPEGEKVFLAIILGYGNENPPVHERERDKLVYLD